MVASPATTTTTTTQISAKSASLVGSNLDQDHDSRTTRASPTIHDDSDVENDSLDDDDGIVQVSLPPRPLRERLVSRENTQGTASSSGYFEVIAPAQQADDDNNHEDAANNVRTEISHVMESMLAHPHDAGLQAKACGALATLAHAETPATIVAQGGLHAIAAALQRFAHHDQVQIYGCAALSALAVADDAHHPVLWSNDFYLGDCTPPPAAATTAIACTTTDNYQSDQPRGMTLIQLVLQALKNFPHHVAVTNAALEVLVHLAELPRNPHNMVQQPPNNDGVDVLAAVLAAMQRHASSSSVQAHGAAVCANWATQDAANRRVVSKIPASTLQTVLSKWKKSALPQAKKLHRKLKRRFFR